MIRIICLSLAGLLCGCAARPASVPQNPPAMPCSQHRGRVMLFRGGVFGVFSRGLDTLADKLRNAGLDVGVYPHDAWRELVFDVPTGRTDYPLILVGHSWGADDAIRLARDIGRSGAAVDLLITLDAIEPPMIPPTVRVNWNVYQSAPGWHAPPWFKGRWTQTDAQGHPRIENLNLWTEENELHEPDLSHWNITDQPKLQRAVVARILSICPRIGSTHD